MIAVFLADGFEEIEAITPIDVLKRAGFAVKTVGVGSKIVVGSHGISTIADITADELNVDEVTLAVFPGGMPGTLKLDAAAITDKVIASVTARGARLAAICAAPMILGKRRLLQGKRAVCYPGFEDHLSGATLSQSSVVTDGNITTAKGAGVALDFAAELVKLLSGAEKSNEILEGMQSALRVDGYASSDLSTEDFINDINKLADDTATAEKFLGEKLFVSAVDIAIGQGSVSTSILQRRLKIGYAKAAGFIDAMESLGIVSALDGQKPRTVLISEGEWREMLSKRG